DVLLGRENGYQVERLEDESEPIAPQVRPPVLRERFPLAPLHPDGPLVRPVEEPEEIQKRRLPRPARPLQRHELARSDRERDVAYSLDRARPQPAGPREPPRPAARRRRRIPPPSPRPA